MTFFSHIYYVKDLNLKLKTSKSLIKSKKNPNRYINIGKYSNLNIERKICDYIAGMTDRYAINLYNKIK